MKALKKAMVLNLDHITLLEDDFIFQPFVNKSMVQSAVREAMISVPNWDVIGLSLNIRSQTVFQNMTIPFSTSLSAKITQIHIGQTTGGFIARKTIFSDMYASFESCDTNIGSAIDQCWKVLQGQYIWIGFQPQPGTQAKSYSDIEQHVVDYRLKR
jgi:hypothetical protein